VSLNRDCTVLDSTAPTICMVKFEVDLLLSIFLTSISTGYNDTSMLWFHNLWTKM
jgi:hypothetical protein